MDVGITLHGPFLEAHERKFNWQAMFLRFHCHLRDHLPPDGWDCSLTPNSSMSGLQGSDPESNWLVQFSVRLWRDGAILEQQGVKPTTVFGLVAMFVMDQFEDEEQVNAQLSFG